MTDEIGRELEKTFHEAAMQHAQHQLKTDRDWREAAALQKRHAEARRAMTDAYQADYGDRVAAKRAELYERRAHYDDRAPRPAGQGVSYDDITRAAHREVRKDHETDLERSRAAERSEMESLLETARQRNLPDGMARDAFTQAKDRRSGLDRRAPTRSQD